MTSLGQFAYLLYVKINWMTTWYVDGTENPIFVLFLLLWLANRNTWLVS